MKAALVSVLAAILIPSSSLAGSQYYNFNYQYEAPHLYEDDFSVTKRFLREQLQRIHGIKSISIGKCFKNGEAKITKTKEKQQTLSCLVIRTTNLETYYHLSKIYPPHTRINDVLVAVAFIDSHG